MIISITLTLAGDDTGPFDIYSNSNGFASPVITGVSRAALLAGYTADIPDGATEVLVKSTGPCKRDLYLNIAGAPIPPISSTTTTSTTQAPVTPTIQLAQPLCKYNNCNDNAACAVKYDISVSNAPSGSYVAIVTNPPSSAANVSLTTTDPYTANVLYYEPSGSATPVYFTLQLKLGSSVIASTDVSISHQSFWQYLGNCS